MKRTKYPIHPDFMKYEKFNPPLNRFLLPIMQSLMRLAGPKEKSTLDLTVSHVKIPVNNGIIRSILYSPIGITDNSPCLIYYHGGGFVFPAASVHYALIKEYAKRVLCKVLLVDYRLAPQYPFPIPPEDCFNAYKWLLEHAFDYGVDINRIAVGGDSAGGELASVVCLMAMDNDIKLPCAQMLIYPATVHALETASVKEFVDTPLCNSKDLEKYEQYYIQDEKAGKWEYMSPLDSESLHRMPRTYIETAEFDCLRDSGILYAEKLTSLNVPTELHNTKRTIHGYDIELQNIIVRSSVDARVEFLKNSFIKLNIEDYSLYNTNTLI